MTQHLTNRSTGRGEATPVSLVVSDNNRDLNTSMQLDRPIEDTVVITSAIYPAPDVYKLKITDPEIRLMQTYCGLLGWMQETDVTRIVICDNTAPPSIFSPIISVAESSDIDLEVLHYKPNTNLISKYGKGYGEGEILSYIMLNSRLIQETPHFYKITGRQYIKNFNKIHALHKGKPIVFRNNPKRRWADTRFFKCSSEFYKTHLIDCYKQVRGRDGVYIEHLFEAVLRETDTTESFIESPVIVGFSGTTGRLYDLDYESGIIEQAEKLLRDE